MLKVLSLLRYFFLLTAACLSLQALAAESDFPVPQVIRPAINFWIRVYTEADTQSGFLHDAQHLNIVYDKLPRDRKLINTRRKEIAADLRVLAGGKRNKLSKSQQQLLFLWGEEVDNKTLAKAASNVRWQLGQSDRFIAGMKRSGAYRRHIEEVVRAKGMPIELAALPHVESSFHPGAYSSAAATGMWQFVRSTAVRFMRVDHVVDERLDPYAATYGAMSLLEYNYNALGTWPLALTAYNHGANGMARALNELGSDDIGRIIAEYKGPRFGFASRNFYPQFLAVLEVERRAEEFFGPLNLDRHPDFASHKLENYLEADTLASVLNLELDQLKKDNPALQPAVWSGTKRIPKGYTLKVDRHNYAGNLKDRLRQIPSAERYVAQIPDKTYRVLRGDSLSLIAQRYKTTVSELVAINQLRNRHRIRIGQTLILPQPEGMETVMLASTATALPIPDDGQYQVKRGDTLSVIAERFKVSEAALLAVNNLGNRNLIFPGQTLRLVAPGPAEAVLEIMDEAVANEEPLDLAEELEEVVAADMGEIDSTVEAEEVDAAVELAEEEAQLLVDLSSDPSDYSVRDDHSIEIQEAETLGHYADWLGIRAWDIRRLNNMSYSQPVFVGSRLKLDFTKVDVNSFERKRRDYHRNIQASYFASWRIHGTLEYKFRKKDFLTDVARRRSVPMWLVRQYNPNLDSRRIRAGQIIVFPIVEKVDI